MFPQMFDKGVTPALYEDILLAVGSVSEGTCLGKGQL